MVPAATRNGAAVAQKVQTLLTDDINGSAAEGMVRFSLDGTDYEIDLNTQHAQQLRDAPGRLRQGRTASQRRFPPARPRRAQRTRERADHYRGPRVGQGPGHRGERPRPGTRRAGREVQDGDRSVNARHTTVARQRHLTHMAADRIKPCGPAGASAAGVSSRSSVLGQPGTDAGGEPVAGSRCL